MKGKNCYPILNKQGLVSGYQRDALLKSCCCGLYAVFQFENCLQNITLKSLQKIL